MKIPIRSRIQAIWPELIEPIALGLLLPVALFPVGPQVIALLLIPFVWAWHWRRSGHLTPRSPLDISILLLVLMVLVSVFVTYDLSISIRKVASLLFGIGVYYAVVRVCRRPQALIIGFGFFFLCGFGAAVLGLLGGNIDIGLSGLASTFRPWQTLLDRLFGSDHGFNPNEVAGVLLWVLLPAASATVIGLRYRDAIDQFIGAKWQLGLYIGLPILTLLMALALALTSSRASYIGVLPTLWILLGVILLPTRRKYWWLASLGTLTLFVVLLVWGSGSGGPNRLLSAVVGSVNDRLEIYSRALYFFENYSWTGMGMNTFVPVTHTFFPMERIGLQQPLGHAHNEFLQAGLDLGFPGLIAFLAVNLGVAGMLWRILDYGQKQTLRPLHWKMVRLLALGLGGGWLSHLIYSLADAVALGAKAGFMYWLFLGLVSGLHNQLSDQNNH